MDVSIETSMMYCILALRSHNICAALRAAIVLKATIYICNKKTTEKTNEKSGDKSVNLVKSHGF